MKKHKILIVDYEPSVLKVLASILIKAGYECITLDNSDEVLSLVGKDIPDLLIIDRAMPGKDGLAVSREIKKKPRFSQIPILMLTGACSEEERIDALESVVDDYYCKPFNPNELLAKIKAILRHSTRIRDSNPTTRLPGGNALEEEVNRRLTHGEVFALMHVDIDNFKAYADAYGFNSANRMIKLCGKILIQAIEAFDEGHPFLSHVGGDDFIIITGVELFERVALKIIDLFDSQVQSCFKKEDLDRGSFTGGDRKGEARDFPITSLSIGSTTNMKRLFHDASEMGSYLVKAKNRAKQLEKKKQGKSTFFHLE
ncbi:MAG: response regulator [Candidatus Eremiobacteraeota bacterium]|nr:response regulator [Candidatus Eremiobacteraeota bacterium]